MKRGTLTVLNLHVREPLLQKKHPRTGRQLFAGRCACGSVRLWQWRRDWPS